MKKYFVFLLVCLLGVSAFGQTKINMRSVDKAECVKSDYSSLKATFSFSGFEATELQSERGVFSTLTMPNTVIGGDEGAPQIPVVNQLIAVPFGATPSIRVTSFSTVDYDLEEYGIHRLSPRQPDVRKTEDTPFVYNEAAYQTRGLRSEPMARVSVDGTMRGVQVGRMSIEPVSYDPVNNKIRVFNDIKVEVVFDGADARATEDMLVRTYSPYFDVLYKQLFNGRALRDVYDEHPDLWNAPVKMLVIANRMFENCIQDWLAWKTMKGIYVDVNYTDNIGTSADAIKTFIQNKYAQDAPTFLVIMGDKDQVAPSIASASQTSCVADLYYSSVDGDEFVDMYHSRISAETTDQMTTILNKALEYEQYTMPDPSYLNNVLLIAGEDSGWGITVGRPTIWYATNYYYNAEHGFDNVYEFSHGDYTNCYAPLSSGVGFANYTAHGSKTSWAGPAFTVDDVQTLTNAHKYFLAIGNCCQSGDWGYTTTCFGEAMIRAENKGAYAYIGSCPNTTWKNDYYFGVGPTNRADGTMPSYEETGTGIYDAIWMDDVYNTVNSILYVGLLAGNAAGALGYELHSNTLYYWQAYHVIGDGSIMPYRVQPTSNNVSHMNIVPIGMSMYEVNAVPGSYVAISKDGVLHGTALVGANGTAQVPITPITSGGDVTICVTAPQRIPYIATVPAAALDGAYISVESHTPTAAHVDDNTNLSITFKNVGTAATSGTTTVTVAPGDSNVTMVPGTQTQTFGSLAVNATTTVSGFQFRINPGVADGTNVMLHYTATNGDDTYEGNIVVKANEAVLEYQNMSWDGGFTPGETLTLTAKFKNTGHYQATNAVAMMSTSSSYINITQPNVYVGTIEVDQEVSCQFVVTIAANCPESAQIPVTFTMTANLGLSAQGNETLKNACDVVFVLEDKYNDGWDGNARLRVSFDDGTPDEELTVASGESPKTYNLEIGNGVHVTLTWVKGTYDGECSFTVSYGGDLVIYQLAQSTNPSAGVLHEFDCNCAAASQTFTVTATSSNTEQGTVSGGGEFNFGQNCTVTATPAEGYMFVSWTQNGEIISNTLSYTFIVNSDMNLVANFAEGTMIGDGGESVLEHLPSYSYYDYSLTQQIYTAEELGEPGIITSIAFYNGGAEKTRTYDFFMKATEKDSFTGSADWIVVTEADKVFSGEVTMAANEWTFITFTTPFVYVGASNVVLVADDNTGDYSSSPHMTCRVFDASSQALRAYRDNDDYDPYAPTSYTGAVLAVKNQIMITKEPIPSEQFNITVSANPTNGGTVSGGGEFGLGESCTVNAEPAEGFTFINWTINNEVVSTEASYTFVVNDDRDLVANFVGSLYVSASVNPANAGTVEGVGEYAYGQTCVLTALPAMGYYFLNWTIDGVVVSTSATYSFVVENDVNLVAHFATGDVIGGGDETNSYLPSYNYYNNSLTEQIYTPEELGDAGLITSIAFFNGGAEKTLDYEFYMKPTEKALFSSDTDWEAVTEADKVFSGRVVMVANDWTTIVFSTPFAYDGTSNVVLVTNKNTAYTSSPHMSCLVFDAPSQAIYAYSDGIIYNPMMPPTSYGNAGSVEYHDVLSVKNQLRITKEPFIDCMAPTQLAATEIGPDFVRLKWSEHGISEQWYVVYNGTSVEANTNEDFILQGLEPETQYTIRVCPVCDENLLSPAISITTLDACPVPQNVEVNDLTASAATVTWGDYNDSYVVQLGNSAFRISENFDNGIPSDWDNNSSYEWILVNGHIQSSNAGYTNSTSSISVTMSFPADGTIEFDAECKGEGTSTYWDHCDFVIDETTQLTAGANINGWNHYIYEVTAGEHTFTWSYTKDGSVNPTGDYFAIDNVEMKSLEVIWEDPVTVGNAEHTFTGLTPATAYCVRVQGICDDNTTEWSDIEFFITAPLIHFVTDGNWNGPDNWIPAGVPEAGQDVIIDASAIIPSGYVANVGHITLNEGGAITIQDGGQLIHTNGSGDDVTVTIEKYIRGYGESTNNEHYYFIAPAPFNQTKLPTQVENLLENEYDLYDFTPNVDDGLEWINFKNPDVTNFKLRSAHGYLYANSDSITLRVTGPAISSTSGGASLQFNYNPDASYMFKGWKLAGNPYLCNGYVYFVNNENEIVPTEFYQMNEIGDGYDQITSADPLKPFEGVFVYSENSGSIRFSTEPIVSRSGALTMNLSQNGARIDMARVRFGQGQNLAKKSLREHSGKLYLPVNSKDYATVFSTETMGEMPVSFKVKENGTYTLSFSSEAVNFSYLHLIDTFTGEDVDLLQTPNYNFEAATTDAPNRFKVVFVVTK